LIHQEFIPNKILILADGGANQERLAKQFDWLEPIKMIGGKPAVYICEDYVCEAPETDPERIRELLLGKDASSRD
jgi:uncharacterized protein